MKRVLALLLSVLMISTFAACSLFGNPADSDELAEDLDEMTASSVEDIDDYDTDTDSNIADVNALTPATGSISFKLVHSYSADEAIEVERYSQAHTIGLWDGERYGLINTKTYEVIAPQYTVLDFVTQTPELSYYAFSDITTYDTLKDMNKMGLMDSDGNQILPMEYAIFEEVNERYVVVYNAVKRSDKEEGNGVDFLYLDPPDALIDLDPKQGGANYEITWQVYDLKEKRFVPGLKGNKPAKITGCGDFIEIDDDNYYRPDGSRVDMSNTTVFVNSCYYVNENGTKNVYDTNGKKLFTYDTEKYTIERGLKDNCFMVKDNLTEKSYVIDATGTRVSEELEGKILSSGGLFTQLIDEKKKLLKFDGTEVIPGTYDMATSALNSTGLCYFIDEKEEGNTYIFTNAEGEFYGMIQAESDAEGIPARGVSVKHDTDLYYVYSFETDSYSIEEVRSPKVVADFCYLSEDAESGNLGVICLLGNTVAIPYEYESIISCGSDEYIAAVKADGSVDLYQTVYDL